MEKFLNEFKTGTTTKIFNVFLNQFNTKNLCKKKVLWGFIPN